MCVCVWQVWLEMNELGDAKGTQGCFRKSLEMAQSSSVGLLKPRAARGSHSHGRRQAAPAWPLEPGQNPPSCFPGWATPAWCRRGLAGESANREAGLHPARGAGMVGLALKGVVAAGCGNWEPQARGTSGSHPISRTTPSARSRGRPSGRAGQWGLCPVRGDGALAVWADEPPAPEMLLWPGGCRLTLSPPGYLFPGPVLGSSMFGLLSLGTGGAQLWSASPSAVLSPRAGRSP